LRQRQNAARGQGCQIGFFDAKFVKFGLFQRQLASKNLSVFFSIFGFFGGSWHQISVLAIQMSCWKVLLGFLKQCLVYFFES